MLHHPSGLFGSLPLLLLTTLSFTSLQQEGCPTDPGETPPPSSAAPTVSLTSPTDNLVTEETELRLEGLAQDDNAVQSLRYLVDGQLPVSLEGTPAAEVPFSTVVQFKTNGQRTLTVEAEDGEKQVGTAQVALTVLEPNDSDGTAVALELPFEGSSLYTDPEDPDYYAFTLDQESVLTLGMTVQPGDKIDVKLHRPSRSLGFYYPFDGAPGTISLLVPAGDWVVAVSANSDMFYGLSLETSLVPEDPLEPNDLMLTATALTLPYTSEDLSLTDNDEDWFSFTLDEQSIVSLDMVNTLLNVRGDVYSTLQDAEGQAVWKDYGEYGTSEILILSAGTWYLLFEAGSMDGISSYPYQLSLTSEAAEEDAFEPNSTQEEAYPLELPAQESARLLLSDDDWYQFSLTSPSLVMLDVSVTSENVTGRAILLMDEHGYVQYSNYDWYDSNIELSLPAGTYYLRVSQSNAVITDYDLKVWIDPDVENDVYEPNDTQEQAPQLVPDVELDSLMMFGAEQDWFTFTLTEEKVVSTTIDLPEDGASINGELKLLDATGYRIAVTYAYYSEPPSLTQRLPAGTYYIVYTGTLYLPPYAAYRLGLTAEVPPPER